MSRLYSMTLSAILLLISFASLRAQQTEAIECGNKYKSCLPAGTLPMPFDELRNNNQRWTHNSPAISTGYYFVSSNSTYKDLAPGPAEYKTSPKSDPASWKKITTGPRQLDPEWWTDEDNREGYSFFRDPASNQGEIFDMDEFAIIDSTNDAFAGPIPINVSSGFRFNGIRYDSFYVSTNGVVALSNRRYLYNSEQSGGGRRIDVETGTTYDPESMDWYVSTNLGRSRNGAGIEDSGNSANYDGTPDDFGYQYVACGNSPLTPRRGIRDNGGSGLSNASGNDLYRAPVIAPLWGDNELSQWSETNKTLDPHGAVWYTRVDNNQLHIYYENLQARGFKNTPCGPYVQASNQRTFDRNYIASTVRVILDVEENSVTIFYQAFNGQAAVTNFCLAAPEKVFLYNTVAGVRGFARHENYNRTTANQVSNPEYEQYTTHWQYEANQGATYPANQLVVRYKQWQNTLRVVDIQYRVRDKKLDPVNNDLSFSKKVNSTDVANYELLAGEERIGAIQPVAIIQNLSNDIQGPGNANYVTQDLEFQARFTMRNKASTRLIWQKTVSVDSSCMAYDLETQIECTGHPEVLIRLSEVERKGSPGRYNYTATHYESPIDDPTGTLLFPGDGSNIHHGKPFNGVPTYGMVQIFFPRFEPSPFIDGHIGRLQAYITAVPQDPAGDPLGVGDQWPFDDTASVPLFVMRRLDQFYDDVNEFHLVDGVLMPSVLKWVNIDAEVVSGNEYSAHPLPPRGVKSPAFKDNWDQAYKDVLLNWTVESPVIKMNRMTLAGTEPLTSPGGDEIRSFPIDMRNKYDAVLSFSIQRVQYNKNWQRGWSNGSLIGPEPRVQYNNNELVQYNNNALAASYRPDEIVVEIANPWVNDELQILSHVTNIDQARWRWHARRAGSDKPIEKQMPAFGLYGAGGYRTGFLEEDKDSAMAPNTTTVRNGLRPDRYDDGIDLEYRKFFVAIPDTFISNPYGTAENFRFRIRVMAHNDQKPPPSIPDDSDDFFVDNVRILEFSDEATDIEVSSVKAIWPYTQTPATQATNIPIQVQLTNNTSTIAPAYEVKLNIYKRGYFSPDQGDNIGEDGYGTNGVGTVYCRTSFVPVHNPRIQKEFNMPGFNAQDAGAGSYKLEAIVKLPEDSDRDPRNDTTYTEFEIKFGDSFAYDNVDNPSNDVPEEINITGGGLNLFGYAYGGPSGSGAGYQARLHGAGEEGGNGSGQIAMKFVLQSADTIKGYRAYFASLNSAPDFIEFRMYEGGENNPDGNKLIKAASLDAQRGVDYKTGDRFYNEYVDYRLEMPVVLQPGTYWMAISQDGEDGLELGATKSRGGMRTTMVHIQLPNPIGAAGVHLALQKEFRIKNNERLLNNNLFSKENSKGSNAWQMFMPNEGNPAYAALHHIGQSPVDNKTKTLSRGFWIPLIRPYFGDKREGNAPDFKDCFVPLEFGVFNGERRGKNVDLYWNTLGKENENSGFYVERRLYSADDNVDFDKLTFVPSPNNSLTGTTEYSWIDNSTDVNARYQYRLRQVSIDGSHNCEASGIVEIMPQTSSLAAYLLNEDHSDSDISFGIENPSRSNVRIEVLDMMGNLIKTIYNDELIEGSTKSGLTWNGTDERGAKVSSGTYMYRVSAAGEVATGKFSIVN